MSQYSQEILKVVVAKICQTIGWHSIQTTPLEIMVDILRRYLSEITKLTHGYATLFGHTQPNLDELGLAFRDLHINVADLEEYVRYVDSNPPLEVPLFPIPKESHLNFLKPGSEEVVTRPVHIYEHLPPMYNKVADEAETAGVNIKMEEEPISASTDTNTPVSVFKRPADISPNEPTIKRLRLVMEEEGRPTREISSVMMTTSGFLSPAREGKLPEARTPISAMESSPSTSNTSSLNNSIVNNEPRFERKIPKIIRDPKKMEKRKDKTSKELFKPQVDEIITKKISTMRDVVRLKAMKANIANNNANTNLPTNPPMTKPANIKSPPAKQTNKTQSKPTVKSEKQLFSPAPVLTQKANMQPDKVIDGKLSSEPDKSKLNIFKKISKVKDEKVEKTEKIKIKDDPIDLMSRESSPDLIIDETEMKMNLEKMSMFKQTIEMKQEVTEKTSKVNVTPEKVYDIAKNSPILDKDFLYDDDLSPPGTPLTPKTPEMPAHSPPLKIEKESKRKRKEKTPKVKNKTPKMSRYPSSPRRNKNENFEAELERPKTPNDPINMVIKEDIPSKLPRNIPPVFPFFPGFLPGGPGLIPPTLANHFNRLPMPTAGFGQPAHIPPAMPALSFVPVPNPSSLNSMPLQPPPMKSQPPINDQVTIEKIPPAQPVHNEPQPPSKKQEQNDSLPPPIKEKHKKDKKDKPKKKNKKDKIKNKSEKRKLKEEKKDKEKIKKKDKKKDKEREHEGSVPKLTLKIGSPRPPTPDVQPTRKLMIKPVVKKDEEQAPSSSAVNMNNHEKREPSPELARFAALITRPPKSKTSKERDGKEDSGTPTTNTSPKQNGPLPGRSRINVNANKQGPASAVNSTIAGVKTAPGKQKPVTLKQQQSSVVDNDGNKVWICPACGGQDDGSPMIGCDDCDAWYHWVCVGIQVPPDDNEDWYCRICIVKKQETIQMDKKKKRKKKERKEH